MRIVKALLVLLFLAPTLAAAEPNPESSFLRIQRDESREPVGGLSEPVNTLSCIEQNNADRTALAFKPTGTSVQTRSCAAHGNAEAE